MKSIDLLLVNPPFHMRHGSGNFLPLGLGYIISAANANGFTTDIINCAAFIDSFYSEDIDKLYSWLRTKMLEFSPLLIGIGPCITSQIKVLKTICSVCREVFPGVSIICGGPLATMSNQEWIFFELLGIEYIIKGDAEEIIPNLLSQIKNNLPIKNCTGVSYSGHIMINEIQDINSIRFPYRIPFENTNISLRRQDKIKQQTTLPMITSRGCIYSCAYCVSGSLPLYRFRKRCYHNIINEMRLLRDEKHTTDIIFYDDCFFHNPNTVNDDIQSFCMLLLKQNINMSWQVELRTDLLLLINESSIKLLEEAGCRQINIGIEKTTDNKLSSIGKSSSVSGLRGKNQFIADHTKIVLTGTFIIGGVGEDESSTKQLIRDVKEFSLTEAHFNPLFIYPGTRLYADLGYHSRQWLDVIMNDKYPWGEIAYESKYLPLEALLDMINLAYDEFYKEKNSIYKEAFRDRFNLRR